MRVQTARPSIGHVAIPLILLLGSLTMFTALQRQLIYFPTTSPEEDLAREAAAGGMRAWHDDDGALIGWRPIGVEGTRRLLVFHGNAGYALHRLYFVRGFQALAEGWEVRLFEYPGYGAREGSPSEEAIVTAAAQALDALLKDGTPVYLLGESLGSGVASQLAALYPRQIAGLVLVTPFTSLVDVAAHHYPWLPVRSLLQDRYDSVAALAGYRGPVAFLLAGDDEIVPPELGRQLHDGYTGPKWLRVEDGAGHNSLNYGADADWWGDLAAFLLAGEPPHPSGT